MSQQPPTAINTRSGLILDFADPDPEVINIDDVAGGLAMAPRFGAQALEFHSVAQHAINVSLLVGHMGHPELELAALHHDSHEAYACDVPRPLKHLLGDAYREVTDRLDAAIAEAFSIEWPEPGSPDLAALKAADNAVFVLEAADLMKGQVAEPDVDPGLLVLARKVAGTRSWDRERAEKQFKLLHQSMVEQRSSKRS